MHIVTGLVLGAAAGVLLILLARIRGPLGARRIYALGLFVTALLYVLLAATRGATNEWATVEAAGVLIYGAAAWLGATRWPRILALGWAAHVVWDLALHVNGGGAVYTPEIWPWFCLSFDLIIAGAVLRDASHV